MISVLKKMVLPVVFIITIVTFFFDFIAIEENNDKKFITGFGLLKNTFMNYSVWIILVLACGFLGFAVSWLKNRIKYSVGFLLALAGIIFLLVSQFAIIEKYDSESKDAISITIEFGYWVSLVAFAIAGSRCYLLQYKTSQKKELPETKGVVNINIITQSNKADEK